MSFSLVSPSPLFIRLRLESLFGRGSGAEVGAERMHVLDAVAATRKPNLLLRYLLQFAAPWNSGSLEHVRERKRKREREREREREGGG